MVDNVTKQFSHDYTAVNQVSFSLKKGELLGLLGPSGCGKTTLLRIIAGFEKPTSGNIQIAEKIVAGDGYWQPPEKRNTGMVFQDYALFPHLNVSQNVGFGLKNQGKFTNKKEIQKNVLDILHLVGLGGLEKRFPHELSGGQQQRVALARALAPQPALILLDEPLSNLDVQVRQRLRHEVRNILKATATTAIFVTHDREEAMAISDRIAVMQKGNLEQIGTPEEIYGKPASRFVAEFVTQANFIPAVRNGKVWQTEIGEWEIDFGVSHDLSKGELMVRQEDVVIQPSDDSGIVVREKHFLGREYCYCLETASGKRLHARGFMKSFNGSGLDVGSKVSLSFPAEMVQVFPDC